MSRFWMILVTLGAIMGAGFAAAPVYTLEEVQLSKDLTLVHISVQNKQINLYGNSTAMWKAIRDTFTSRTSRSIAKIEAVQKAYIAAEKVKDQARNTYPKRIQFARTAFLKGIAEGKVVRTHSQSRAPIYGGGWLAEEKATFRDLRMMVNWATESDANWNSLIKASQKSHSRYCLELADRNDFSGKDLNRYRSNSCRYALLIDRTPAGKAVIGKIIFVSAPFLEDEGEIVLM